MIQFREWKRDDRKLFWIYIEHSEYCNVSDALKKCLFYWKANILENFPYVFVYYSIFEINLRSNVDLSSNVMLCIAMNESHGSIKWFDFKKMFFSLSLFIHIFNMRTYVEYVVSTEEIIQLSNFFTFLI